MMQPHRPRRPVVPPERRDQLVRLLSKNYTAPGWAYLAIIVTSVLGSSTILGAIASIFALIKVLVIAGIIGVVLIAILRFGVSNRKSDS